MITDAWTTQSTRSVGAHAEHFEVVVEHVCVVRALAVRYAPHLRGKNRHDVCAPDSLLVWG